MQELAFKDPTGRVYLLTDAEALPPLAQGYEWTTVVRPDRVIDPDDAPAQGPGPAPTGRPPGFLDVMLPLLTPSADQSPQERAQELIDAIPEDVRGKLAQLFRALVPPRAPQLPPFPGVRT